MPTLPQMSKLTPQQIDRALNIGEKVVDLAVDVWRTRKKRVQEKPVRNKSQQFLRK
ncbi:hypothetical protein OpiT1DRAFT_05689 [Opitutaceae bacterium TAV1]|nr:hypothetical protein OpiT1DRAFT_05689 [Opitutaceae bacterium TAV1]